MGIYQVQYGLKGSQGRGSSSGSCLLMDGCNLRIRRGSRTDSRYVLFSIRSSFVLLTIVSRAMVVLWLSKVGCLGPPLERCMVRRQEASTGEVHGEAARGLHWLGAW